MKVGITLPLAGQQATRENIIQAATQAEGEGFDSVWVFERLLWPLKPQTPYPGTPDGSLPIEYQNIFDPIETLSFVAANTSKISLGTSVIDMLFHNPVILARRFATLDVMSQGRVYMWTRNRMVKRRISSCLMFHSTIKVKGQMNLFRH